jgi:hypothetical protein
VLAGFIIGFDHDTADCFEQQYRFITEAGIQSAMIGLLTALPKTPLYERLKREARLRTLENVNDNTRPSTNVVPLGMSYEAMVEGYMALYRRLLEDGEIAKRIRNKLRFLARPAAECRPVFQSLTILWRLFWRGIVPGGPARLRLFLRTLELSRPFAIPVAVSEWIVALSMREFALRQLVLDCPADREPWPPTSPRISNPGC